MLKSVVYAILFAITALRLSSLIFLLVTDSPLPPLVMLVTSAVVLYGIVLLVKRFLGGVRLKQLMAFYIVQAAMSLFNLLVIMAAYPLEVTSPAEIIVTGTLLDLLVGGVIVYLCVRQIRSSYPARLPLPNGGQEEYE